jgi:hypothetical protein
MSSPLQVFPNKSNFLLQSSAVSLRGPPRPEAMEKWARGPLGLESNSPTTRPSVKLGLKSSSSTTVPWAEYDETLDPRKNSRPSWMDHTSPYTEYMPFKPMLTIGPDSRDNQRVLVPTIQSFQYRPHFPISDKLYQSFNCRSLVAAPDSAEVGEYVVGSFQ